MKIRLLKTPSNRSGPDRRTRPPGPNSARYLPRATRINSARDNILCSSGNALYELRSGIGTRPGTHVLCTVHARERDRDLNVSRAKIGPKRFGSCTIYARTALVRLWSAVGLRRFPQKTAHPEPQHRNIVTRVRCLVNNFSEKGHILGESDHIFTLETSSV